MLRIGLAALLSASLGAALAAEPAANLQSRQAEAQSQQGRLRDRIQTLQKDIDQHEASRKDAANALKASETAISDIDRRLAELARQKREAEGDLERLQGQIAEQRQELGRRQQELADQLRAQYASGLSPWTALLSGDDPQAIGRELGYLSYVSQAQAAALRAVGEALERLNALQARSQARKRELEQVADETEVRKTELEEQKRERQQVLEKVSEQLKAQRAQAEKLQSDERRLGRLITGLEEAIAKQAEEARLAEERRREEARLAEIRRQEEARRRAEAQRAEQERLRQEEAQRQSRRDQEAARRAREQVEQARARERAQERAARQPAQEEPAPPAAGALQGLRHGVPYPVRGEVQGRFGAERPDGGLWRGIVLRASEGTPVKAIAAGRVVYADWLNGFGNILIVDHGAQYLSVYAYNQSLLKQVGQTVAAGEAIATVGATGGQVESGLYFEIRHQGKPVNPLLWLAR
ncbi:peptidoglycan DD-metalloendopeptidase family protein [Pusillimonas sp.]|uniref:peptidoglycan DD-metalloendopeptidase family protein n=1 Tax=Pusillimonas sp. TaxID=3040095 RepID=UPI0029BA02BE|nr:peptidoglycan DD-metalloendopeptidase family protein [Pusillimonas sp.]MDX3894720.1 peptidoglycan DD-metalloendopeptidase family protein [Pusillimonas sp.]